MSAPPEERFGPYRVLGVLGNGGMGRVLRAHDAEHQRDVALKVLHPQWAQDENYRSRFRREAQIAARLNEPHVIPIHRYGEIDGQLFLDMRLVEGENLDSLLRRSGPMDPARAVDVVGQVARALDAAHAGGLVHRDVKPSNVLLVARGDGGDLAASAAGEDFAYLADFGIARMADEGTGPALTTTGTAIGSTEYMAPERFGPNPPDARSDVYSLACVLFELLTGSRPVPVSEPVAAMYAHLHEQPPAPSRVRPGVPAALDGVVLRGLAKDPAQRWQTAGQLAAAARSALAASGVPVPPPDGVRAGVAPAPVDGGSAGARRASRGLAARAPWLVATAALAAVVLLAVVLVVLDRRVDAAREGRTEAAERLVRFALPAGLDRGECSTDAPGDGELYALSCPAAGQPDGFPASTWTVLADDGAEAAVAAVVHDLDLPELDDVFSCGDEDAPEGWVQLAGFDDEPLGRLTCTVDGDGDPQLRWYWEDLGVLGFAELRGGGAEALADLQSWWSDNADRGL
ncbi:serine/threonine-protein kinase [Blastococcus litoris]|uniref:serine/threonine-protein kinase n=1 Tax=Blastococcus litoris TaxID=2171622 RepID=UPI0019D1EC58|nr:serine/threonine-protein kinase [Blastococcus litoris]